MVSVKLVFKIILSICVLGFIILYYTGLGLLTNAMFNITGCGCTETSASGELPIVVCSGTTCATINPGIPFSTSITPIGDKQKLILNSSDVVVSKISICVTWTIMIILLIIISSSIYTGHYAIKIVLVIIILVITIFYFTALGILTRQIFSLGDCGCEDVVSAQPGTSSYFKNIINNNVERFDSIKKKPISTQAPTPAHTIIPGTPATVITTPADRTYSLDNYNNSAAIGYSKFGLIFTWIINIILIIYIIFNMNIITNMF